MTRLTSSRFMAALPEATRAALPPTFNKFRAATRGWLCQLYDRDPRIHYEVWNLGERRGLLELGLHFESPDRARNAALCAAFGRQLIEIKATLGVSWEAELWDRGWAKVYETLPYEPFSTQLLESVAARLARAILLLHPMLEDAERRLG